jgi:hypothetical protein
MKLVISFLRRRHIDCAGLLQPSLSNGLHQYRKDLWQHIKVDAPRFAILAAALGDTAIMIEAFVHMIGWTLKRIWLTSRENSPHQMAAQVSSPS